MMQQQASLHCFITSDFDEIACSLVLKEAFWFSKVFQQLSTCASESILVYCDSMTTPAYIKSPKCHDRIKHVDIRCHQIRYIA